MRGKGFIGKTQNSRLKAFRELSLVENADQTLVVESGKDSRGDPARHEVFALDLSILFSGGDHLLVLETSEVLLPAAEVHDLITLWISANSKHLLGHMVEHVA